MPNTKKRQGFILYHEDLSLLDELSDEEFRTLIMALASLPQDKEIPPLSGAVKMAYQFMSAKVIRDDQRYNERCVTNKNNVNKRYNTTTEYDCIPSYPTGTVTGTVRENKKSSSSSSGGAGGLRKQYNIHFPDQTTTDDAIFLNLLDEGFEYAAVERMIDMTAERSTKSPMVYFKRICADKAKQGLFTLTALEASETPSTRKNANAPPAIEGKFY